MPAALDLDFVRAHFPALNIDPDVDGAGAPWVLMDNAGGSVPCRAVTDRVTAYMRGFGVQLGASYPRSQRAGELVQAGTAAAARLFATSPDQILLGASTTMNVYVLARALAQTLSPGDEIIVSELDHEANVGAWRRLAAEGAVIKMWPMHVESASLRLDELAPLLSARTRLVCFTHCPNVVGNIHDVRTFTDAIHDAGALACVDGVAYAPHRRIDVEALGADIYLASLYKVYGPHVGAAFIRDSVLAQLPGQNHFFIGDEAGPYKLEPGNVNHELTASLVGIVDYLEAVAKHHGVEDDDPIRGAFSLFAAHEARLAAPVIDMLRDHPKCRLIGAATADAEVRAPTIAFCVPGTKASEIPTALDGHRVAIRWGDFYAPRAIERLGLTASEGIVRISMVHYNTMDEVERLLTALDTVL